MSNYILAFDHGCPHCHSIGQRVADAVAGAPLELRDLSALDVVNLRRSAFGGHPPWLPTLIAVNDEGEVRAWTGAGLSMRLAGLLGPARSLRVVRALGQHEQEEAVTSPGRRRFLKAIPGAAAGAVVISGGATAGKAFAGPTQASPDLDVKRVGGSEAAATLDNLSSDRAVIDLAEELGIDLENALANAEVEQLPQDVEGVDAKRYVSVPWVDDADRLVRTGHFISADGSIESSVFDLTKTGSDPTLRHGELGGKTETLTESQAQAQASSSSVPAAQSSFIDCVALCLGVSSAFVTMVLAGCGLACAITLGTACILCAAAAFGFSVGTTSGCFFGCA